MQERILIVILFFITGVILSLIFKKYSKGKVRNAKKNFLKPEIPAVLYFWSTDCTTCKTLQRPVLNEVFEEFKNMKIQFVDINVTENINFASDWGVLTVPSTFILDKKGECIHANNGIANKTKLLNQIKSVL